MARLVESEIQADELLGAVRSDADGGLALFVGVVRDHNDGRRVSFLEYEAYGPMAVAEMEKIEVEAVAKFGVSRVAIVHRVGRLEIGEVSVAVAVASHHRAEALDACRFAIDTLKHTVPIWKKEHFEGGAVWIEGCGHP
ncbi:MAG TPA: molybdenum cofactor biosynthesis protein MoaE [Candidatus Polarisedimenticolaceae bacterium]